MSIWNISIVCPEAKDVGWNQRPTPPPRRKMASPRVGTTYMQLEREWISDFKGDVYD
jgi:hypothetical protein